MQSVMTSIRLAPKLSQELEHMAEKTHHVKNWIISRALEAYFVEAKKSNFKERARQEAIKLMQSKKGIKKEKEELELWLNNADTTGWT